VVAAPEPDIENQMVAPGAPDQPGPIAAQTQRLPLIDRLRGAHRMSVAEYRDDMRTTYNRFARNKEGFKYACTGLGVSVLGTYGWWIGVTATCSEQVERTKVSNEPCTLKGIDYRDCPKKNQWNSGCVAKSSLGLIGIYAAPFALYAALLGRSLVQTHYSYLANTAIRSCRLTADALARFDERHHNILQQQNEDDNIIAQRFVVNAQRPVIAAEINTNVHDQQRLGVARQQMQALMDQTKSLSKLTDPIPKRAMAAFKEILSAIRTFGGHQPNQRDLQIRCDAENFYQQVKNDHHYQKDYGHLIASPNDAIMKLWQVFRSVENDLMCLDAPALTPQSRAHQANIREKYPLLRNTRNITTGLIEEMANVVTDYASGANPCGAGQISRLLNYSASIVPALNPFAGRLTSVPNSLDTINEYIADITRQVGILERAGTVDESEQKAVIKNQFVVDNDLMTGAVFEVIYQKFADQLMGIGY